MSRQKRRNILSPEQQAKLLRLYQQNGVAQAALARRFEVSNSYVHNLIARAKQSSVVAACR